MSENDKNMEELRLVRWKSHLERQIEKFSEITNDKETFNKYFGESYVEKLSNKTKELSRIIIKLAVVYTIIMLSLFASQISTKEDFEILGYGFKNLKDYKEFLLLLATSISPISAVVLAYYKYILALTKESIKKLSPNNNVRKYYTYMFLDEYFDSFLITQTNHLSTWHSFTRFIMFLLGLTMIFLVLTLLAGSFLIQINVIYDVFVNPSSSKYVNYFVITFSIISILFSWLVSIIQLPMPEIDKTYFLKLSEIEKNNPDEYKRILRKMNKDDKRKDMFVFISISTIVYLITYSVISVYVFSENLNDITYFLENSMLGVFLVMFSSYFTIEFVQKKCWSWFFRNYKNETDEQMRIFVKLKKILLLLKILLPFFISLIYIFVSLSK